MKVAVIGGGAAGLMACGRAAERADQVVLIEPNRVLGRKVRITGKGRCNVTNSADVEEILEHIPKNPKFLYSALYGFTNQDVIRFFEERGVPLKEERGGRIFPQSDQARDIAEALAKYALAPNVTWKKCRAESLLIIDGAVRGVKTDRGDIFADRVILATGGASYPLTGSDGSGYRMAERAGHTVVPIRPSLVPMRTREKWVSDVMGLSLKNVELRLYDRKNRMIYSDFGEMLFTHFGISGPIVLSASAHCTDGGYRVEIDLKPALSEKQLDQRICRDFETFRRKHLINALDELLPKALIPVMIELSGVEPHKEVSMITREERLRFGALLKAVPLEITGLCGMEEAIVTAGGVKVSEIDPSTMQSKVVRGLFFAGEVIDVDAYTGGFNLQIAFSTGVLAGENIQEG